MKRLLLFGLLLLVGAEVFAQGSAPSPPQLWRRKGTADTSFIVIKTGDTVMVYDTSIYTKIMIRGANEGFLIPDSLIGTTLRLTDRVISPNVQVGQDGGGGSLIFDNFASATTLYSLLGNGLENSGGYLTVTIGSSVEGSEVTNQTLTKSDIDTTATFPFGALYHKTTAVSDSEYKTKYYIDHNLFGYSVTGTPSSGQVPVYDGGTGGWSFGSGGSGSGDDIRFDMTLSNSDYTLGPNTYTGGYINTSTVWMRGDTGLNIVKSGQHPGDTMLFTPDWARVQRNDSTLSIRSFKNAAGEYMMIMEDSSSFTKITTGNISGTKFNQNLNIDGNLRFFGSNREVDSLYAIKGSPNSFQLKIFDSDTLGLQTLGSNAPVLIGSSSNWTIHSDTIKGVAGQSRIFNIESTTSDTVRTGQIRMQSNSLKFLSDTTNPTQDVAMTMTRDTANDTTKMTVSGKLQISADAGFTEMDSVTLHGRLRMYDGTNKSSIDSAKNVSADSLRTLPGGYFGLYGATSGRTRIRGNASAITNYDLTLPAAQGSANQALINDGSGNLSWGSAGTGNGSADFDTTSSLDSNALKGAGGTVLLTVKKNATPSVVVNKGSTMTSLILGGDNSGLTAIDTAALIYNNLYFGATVNKQTKIDSTFVYEQLKKNRYYFTASDLYWSPEKSNAADDMFLTWNMCDTSATWPDNAHKASLFALADSVGDSHRPLNITWNASERDSLFSFHWKYLSDSLAGTGSTDTSKMMYPNYAFLYVNQTRVDSVFIGKTYASATADSINFTDRAIAVGDVVTVMIWFETQVTATAMKRVKCDWAYLNMRRY